MFLELNDLLKSLNEDSIKTKEQIIELIISLEDDLHKKHLERVESGNYGKTLTERNAILKKELWGRAYFVSEVGDHPEIDYIVVSAKYPKQTEFASHLQS